MNDVLTEVRFWAQVMGDAKRLVMCEPDMESRVKGWIEARGMSHLLTVDANPYCPAGTIYVVDEQAINAAMSRPIKLRMWP